MSAIQTDPIPAKERTSVSERDLLSLVQRQLDAQERQTNRMMQSMAILNKTIEVKLDALRRDVLIITVLCLILLAARDGILAKVGIPGVTIETHSASQVDQTGGGEP